MLCVPYCSVCISGMQVCTKALAGMVGRVQARPRLDSTRFQKIDTEKDNSAFNMNLVFLSLRLYSMGVPPLETVWGRSVTVGLRYRLRLVDKG